MRPLLKRLRSNTAFPTLSTTTAVAAGAAGAAAATIASITVLSGSSASSPSPSRLQPFSSNTTIRMSPYSSSSPTSNSLPTFTVRKYTPKDPTGPFPYTSADLRPMDPGDDTEFYSAPRFVTHIDDHAITLLRQYYSTILPLPLPLPSTSIRPRVLDLCSSWISHYPVSIEEAAHSNGDIGIDFAGLGMNAAELAANPLFRPNRSPARRNSRTRSGSGSNRSPRATWCVKDLNTDPHIPELHLLFNDVQPLTESKMIQPSSESSTSTTSSSSPSSSSKPDMDVATLDDVHVPQDEKLSTTTLTVSVDYLTSPIEVLSSLRNITKEGGTVHMAISNRCFPSKAVAKWLKISEEERLEMVGDYLWWSGWREIEIVTLSKGVMEGEKGEVGIGDVGKGGLGDFMSIMGLVGGGKCDPLWVVRGKNLGD